MGEQTNGASRRGAKRGESPAPRQPEGWRDFTSYDYDYPEELTDLSRRERRRAKREWRAEDQAQRVAWLRNQRQAEPASPLTIVVAVLLLALVVLGLGGGLPKLLKDENVERPPIGLLTPAPPVTSEPADEGLPQTTVSSSPPPAPTSIPPVVTERPSAGALSVASHVANEWAHDFYTRDPAKESYDQLVDRTARFVTGDVVESLKAAGDPTYEALRSANGKSTVLAAPVTAPREGSAPVDTPTRITRLATIVINVTGKEPDRITLPLLITLIPQDGQWVISEIDGGTGP